MGHFARKFQSHIGSPSVLYPPLSPHQLRFPLHICARVPDILKKTDIPVPFLRHLVGKRLADFERCVQVFTDGPVRSSSGSPTAAFPILNLAVDHSGELNVIIIIFLFSIDNGA